MEAGIALAGWVVYAGVRHYVGMSSYMKSDAFKAKFLFRY